MSILTTAWSMCAAASFMLALLHLLLWFKDRQARVYLLSVLMAASAGAVALTELAMMNADSIDAYRKLIQWENLFVYGLLLSTVWFVKLRLPLARSRLAILISMLWTVAIVVNWLSPYSLVFAEITSLQQMPTFWGEEFTLAEGSANPWVHLANLASVLIVLYVLDAAVRSWRAGEGHRALLVGGSVATFIVLGGIHAPLVDTGIVETPYMIGFAFLAIVLALSYELVSEAMLASRYAKEIRASDARWRSLLTDVQLAVIGIDPAGRVNYSNPFLGRLTDYTADELRGRPVASLVPVSDRVELDKRLADAARTGPRAHSRWDLVCASGARRTLAWSTVRLTDPDGRYAGLLSIGEDMTDRLAAERKLESTRRELEQLGRANMLGELVSTLAHELNQPLTAILSNAQAARRFMRSGGASGEEIEEILDDIVRDDKRAGEVIAQLRVMLGKGKRKRERTGVADLIDQALLIAGTEIDAQAVAVDRTLEPDLPDIEVDRVAIQQVLLNLLINALHAVAAPVNDQRADSQRRVHIEARCSRAENLLVVSVEDRGPGIPVEVMPRLFEPFFTTKSEGLGMGLAICRRILETHGGTIRAENTGTGARLSFSLPCVREAERDG